MQLAGEERGRSVRHQIRAAACMLLASGASRWTQAADVTPTNTVDVTTLFYNERISVFEPVVRFTRLYPSGMSFHGQMTIDSITGASPSGALPSGVTQTVTSSSGHVKTISGDTIPTTDFKDTRYALDGEWLKPLKGVTSTLGGHVSREKDYQSLGVTGKVSFDLDSKLTTLTVGGGYNSDDVFPIGGTTAGLVPSSTATGPASQSKQVASAMIGVSQVLTRRWLVGVSASLDAEHGYLTEPYKVVSVVDASTGIPIEQLTEKRPGTRNRRSLQLDSVYHLTTDLLYVTLGSYRDDWGIGAASLDLRYRHPAGELVWVEPHLRYYAQNAADFFHIGLVEGQPLPEFASADYRIGKLNTITAGFTVGLQVRDHPGAWTLRAEYMAQNGDGHPGEAVGVQRQYDLFPTLNVFSVVVGYNLSY
jgi:hypothetical protein